MLRTNVSNARGIARALLVLGLALGGCNLLVGEQVDQCSADEDCKRFNNGSVCRDGVCVLDGTGGTGGTGTGGGDCFAGEPKKDSELLNACTNADCEPFDNCARLKLCPGDSLPPLVDPPAP